MPLPCPPFIAVVGAGPAGLMAAETLAQGGAHVRIYDRMASPGRKFLLAGRGGLNLTHSEPLPAFLDRYGAAAPRLSEAVTAFSPDRLREWSENLGEPTFVGSSGRVFPRSLKASPLLREWLRRLGELGVTFAPRHRWIGFEEDGALRFLATDGPVAVRAQAVILALGGASWPHLGSTGDWTEALEAADIQISPLRPANCGFTIAWSDIFRSRFEGAPLKGAAFRFRSEWLRGEAIVTRHGIEGGAIYALSAPLREAILSDGEAILEIALRADLTIAELETRLAQPRGKQSLATYLRKTLKLSPVAIGLLQEASRTQSQHLSSADSAALARLIAAVPLRLSGVAPITRAISTAGGVSFDEIDTNFMLLRRPGIFVAGEMLDWEAPTGGYLLQACMATGVAAGCGVAAWLRDLEPAAIH